METGNPSNKTHEDHHGKKPSKTSKEPLKVKYISSPVMVNAKNAEEFKAIVQGLTGKDSSDSSEGHRQRSPEVAEAKATSGETHAKLDQIQGSISTVIAGGYEFEKDVFWKLSESLSKCEFPYR